MTTLTDVPDVSPSGKQFFPFLLVLAGAALILLGGIVLTIVIAAERHPVSVPDALAGVPRTAEVTGDDALTEISRLHGKGFPLVDGVMGVYGGGVATVWASGTWLPIMADKQVEAMTDRIAEGSSPFNPTGTHEISGLTVHFLTGMGQLHFYFAHKQQVIWLAADTDIAEAALNDLLASLQ